MDSHTRRTVLRSSGVAIAAGLAGCTGGGNGDGGDDTLPGEDYPAIDEWLTETSVGDADGTYDGTVLDRRDQDTLTVDVGAQGNGGSFAFGPSAVAVSAGTTIEWNWTGKGNPHNVEAEPDGQIGESNYEFSSGEAQGGSGVQYTQTLSDAGLALYHCEPHLSLGMKGAIAVE